MSIAGQSITLHWQFWLPVIPSEILKKVRRIEIGISRFVTATLPGAGRSMFTRHDGKPRSRN